MRQLDASIYICLIDGVAALHSRLLSEHFTEHTLKDLIVWREEEIIGTRMLCKGINEDTPFYCLAHGGTEETIEAFYRLVFEPKIKRAYLSFPMTAVTDLEDVKKEIGEFRQTMKKHFTCLTPAIWKRRSCRVWPLRPLKTARIFSKSRRAAKPSG